MTPPDKNEVIKILQQISGLLTLKGEAVFKTRSYDKAAETLTAMTDDLATVVAAGKLEELEGFGKSLSAKVKELMTTGTMAFFEDLKKEYPLTLLDIGQVPGVGPKKVVQFYKELSVSTLADLEQACIDHKVMALKGCGEKTEQTILEGLQLLKKHSGRTPLWKARPVAEAVLAHVRKAPHIVRAEIGGSTRRFAETVGDVDIISSVTKQEQADEVMKHFLTYPGIDKVLGSGHTKTSVLLTDGFQLDLRVIEDHDFGTALHHFTGSKAHHIELRQLALKQNKMLSEYGIHKLKPDGTQGDKIKINTEQELYAELGLEFVPPELREGKGEIDLASKKALGHIIERDDLKGSTH
jgi:DNA polymerase (family 10)